MIRRLTTLVASTLLAVFMSTAAASACGFLVAENGAVRLNQFTALAAVGSDGLTHYVTSFDFAGGAASFGAIIPLPGEPSTVEAAGNWTLQRLGREVNPPNPEEFAEAQTAASSADAEVVASYEVDSLDIDIVRGGAEGVLAWGNDNGFDIGVGEDALDMLAFYADRSPWFAAIRYDLERAEGQQLIEGDGTPVHFAFDEAPWIPLRVLAFDKPGGELVQADLYLLTPDRPRVLTGPGLTPTVSQRASDSLMFDLADDENSSWVPEEAWLTYYDLAVDARDLTYDLAVAPTGKQHIERAQAFGIRQVTAEVDNAPPSEPIAVPPVSVPSERSPIVLFALALTAVAILAAGGTSAVWFTRRR